MKRCALSCLKLCMAMAVLGQKDPSATVATMQRNALHDSTDQKSGLTVPIFHQLSVRSKAQPINLSGLADIQAYHRPTNKKDHGSRRVELVACDTEKTALYSCFPDPACAGCYDGLIKEANEQTKYCGEFESMLCAINTTCVSYSCGCEYQADRYFQCLIKDWGCENVFNCCDTEKTAFYSCFSDPACEGCYDGFISETLEQSIYCGEIEGRLCRIHSKCSTCGCEDQADPYFQCRLNEEGCESVVVNCPNTTCEEELISLSECEDQLNVDPTCLDCVGDAVDTTAGCLDIQSTAWESAATCGCGICADKIEALYACTTCPAKVCNVCGDETMKVTAGLTVKIDNEVQQCSDVQAKYGSESSEGVSPSECNILIEMVKESCNCMPVNLQDSDGGSDLAFLWALVAIPFIAVIVYLLMRKKPDDHPVNVKTPINVFSETPRASPSPNRCYARTPESQRDLSADEFYVNDRPNGSTAYSASHYSGGRSASESVRSHEDHHHGAFEELGVGSGRINGPPRMSPVSPGSSNWNTASAAATSSIPNSSISSTNRNTGGYVVRTKDQCRSVYGEVATPVAILVEDVVPMEPRRDQSKRSCDP